VVVNGLIGARILISHESSFRRLYGVNAWDVFMILLNCFVFVLIGLEVNDIVEVMPWDSIFLNIFYAFVFWGAMMAVRMFWVFFKHSGFYLRNLSRWRASSSYVETLSQDLILGWAGIRGIVSLTVALAIPRFMNDGTLTPGRDLVIFLTFAVIMISLLVPGFSLPWLLNKLSLHRKESRGEIEKTRQYLAKVAEDEIHALHQNQKLNDEEKSFFNNYFNVRQLIFANAMEMGDRQIELLRRKVVQRQRQMLIGQWQGGQIDDHILKVLERELDLEETLTDRPEV
jgi:CPA1 family monovalent cation:H+ antiporter